MTYEKFLAEKFNYDEDMVVLNYNNKELQKEYNENYKIYQNLYGF